jgi:hypothetical protein
MKPQTHVLLVRTWYGMVLLAPPVGLGGILFSRSYDVLLAVMAFGLLIMVWELIRNSRVRCQTPGCEGRVDITSCHVSGIKGKIDYRCRVCNYDYQAGIISLPTSGMAMRPETLQVVMYVLGAVGLIGVAGFVLGEWKGQVMINPLIFWAVGFVFLSLAFLIGSSAPVRCSKPGCGTRLRRVWVEHSAFEKHLEGRCPACGQVYDLHITSTWGGPSDF